MKKYLLIVVSVLLSLSALATYKPGYYDRMDGKRREDLKKATKECVQTHTMLNYTNLPNNWVFTDVYPDLVNGQRRWWEMYSDEIYLIRSGQSGLTSFRDNKMQREHSVPKSWWGSDDTSPAWTDIYNLYPSDGPANQAKSNYPLGPVGSPSFNNGVTKVGVPKPGYGGSSGIVFEPADEYKGDFARAYFYVFTVYDQLNWTGNSMANRNEWPTLKPWAYELLLQWARQDPVSQKEITRNDAAERQQGNRNPFVDFPELAEYIWGTKNTEVFYIKDQGGGSTPPITGDPELTSPINGEALDFGETAVGSATTAALIVNGSNLTSSLTIRVTGTDRKMFTLETNSLPAAQVNQQGGTKVNIIYKPTSEGNHTAALTIYDGGLKAEQQVNVQLRGQALAQPSLSQLTAYDATNITDTEYIANWSVAPEVIDYYVLTRTRLIGNDQVTTTEEVDVNYLTVTDCNPGITEIYYVQSSRLGFLSPKSNSVTVTPGGVVGVDAGQQLILGTTIDGLTVLNDQGAAALMVRTMDGRNIAAIEQAAYGTFIPLPTGIYIVTARNCPRPVKILIH